ncbi:sensor histidine kinase [Geodermatophilus ruber]|uniref:histidine kinase n=1 Tax=Geodermatophilus ruber TaxID=504800 RepID=A0A1I4IS60_9ACTN|nr:HAMP domain-containing sensor histidine kinase [Geodermatophilus ruber]SFL57202.1 Signal transduction histidine kinase [Geodermatophilus ruber]
MRLGPRSLRARLTLVVTLGAAAAVGLALALLYITLDRQLATTLDRDLTARGNDLAAAVAAGGADAVARDPLAQLYAADGALLAGSPSLGERRLLAAGEVRHLDTDRLETRILPARGGAAEVVARVLSQPLDDARVLSVGVSVEPLRQARQGLLQVLLLAAPLLLAAVAGAGWLVIRAALQPVDVLTREVASIVSFDAERTLPTVPGDDEVARLAATLDAMLVRLRVAFERERAFVDDASHELRTPVAVLRGELELALLAADDPGERERALLTALDEAERLSRLAEDLLLLARERAGSLILREEPIDLLDLVASEAARLRPALGLRIRVSGDPVVVVGDDVRLRQVLVNLVQNSAAAGATTVRLHTTAGPGAVALEVADDGPGLPPEVLHAAFERFVRGERSRTGRGAGAGLGLSIVRAVVTAHGGTVEARNDGPLGGAAVTVRLPRHPG